MRQYYYLITGLPELSLDDNKLSYSVSCFKEQFYPSLSRGDRKLVDLFYLRFDNENILRLLKDRSADVDLRGNFSKEQYEGLFSQLEKKGVPPSPCVFPSYLVQFVQQHLLSPQDESEHGLLPEDELAGLYYAHAMKCNNEFVAGWFEFNMNLNNIMSAFTARKLKAKVGAFIVGDTEVSKALKESNARDFGLSSEVDYMDALMKISDLDNLVEREKKLDQLRWKMLEDMSFFKYFSIERLYVFLLQLDMTERWLSLDKEKGNQMFRDIISALKNEVRVPEEY